MYCAAEGDCADSAPYVHCDVMHHSCVIPDGGGGNGGDGGGVGPDMICGSSAECSDVAPICFVGRCRACEGAGDDPQCVAHDSTTPRCNAPTGQCVACLMSADCPKAAPVCNVANFTCHKCVAHSECSSGICDTTNGTCVDATDIAYVNNASGACSDTMHASTPTMPYCQIQYAASNAPQKFILVSGSATAYNALALNATTTAIGPLTIVGPAGRGTAMKATVTSTTLPALFASTTAAALTLTVDGLDFIGASGAAANAEGIKCQGGSATATLTIKNSTIEMSGTNGVNSSGCVLALDASIISANASEGVLVASSTYVITNNIIHHNGSNSGLSGVNIDAASTGTFAFNTVAANGGANAAFGGIVCAANGSNKLIEDSIVAQNAASPMSNGSQFTGKCQLQSVVPGPDAFSGAIQMAPAFLSITDFHLDTTGGALATNQACCIDKLAGATTPNATHDVDFGPRPKVPGGKLDIGAHEAQ